MNTLILRYYWDDGSLTIFDNYTIDSDGIIKNATMGNIMTRRKSNGGKYNRVTVRDNFGKTRAILVGRAIASTFLGTPPTKSHTADHIDQVGTNDVLKNIRWLDKKGQRDNQSRMSVQKSAFIVIT